MENESDPDRTKLARGYLVLGEAEENLEKLVRAIKYYKIGLSFIEENDERDKYMILFLHFKIGMINSRLNKSDEAIEYLDKTVVLYGVEDEHMKINSLVSIAKIYGSKDENEKAFPYLEKVIPMFEDSALTNTMVHAEALTEIAFYYFDQSMLDEAVSYYDRAIEIYLKQSNKSSRKLGMIYMQYAYCLEHQKNSNKSCAGESYENAIEQLEKTNDRELLENALADVITFFDHTNDAKKSSYMKINL